MSFDINMP